MEQIGYEQRAVTWRGRVMVASVAALLATVGCDSGSKTTEQAETAAEDVQIASSEAPAVQEPVAEAETGEAAEAAVDPAAEKERLLAFFEEAYQEYLARSPLAQSYRGIKNDYDKWDDLSEAFADETLALAEARLEQLRQFERSVLDRQAQLSYDLFEAILSRQIEDDRFRHHDYVMNQFRAWHTIVPSFLINIHRVSAPSDAEAYVARLEKVGGLFDQVIAQMKIREEKGIFPPDWSYPQMIEASRNVIAGAPFDDSETPSTLMADFQEKVTALELDAETTQTLMDRATAALTDVVKPAYETLIGELERQAGIVEDGDGAWRLPDGGAYYANRLRYFTTTGLTAEEIHQIGLDNVARIHDEMRAIMATVGFEGSLQEFFEFMRTDDQFYYPNTDEGRAAYLARATALIDTMRERLPEVFGIFPKAELVVKRVEPFRERSAGKAFYQRPAQDGSRPGTYYANLYDMSQMPIYQMEALAYHEAIPGHHMQIAIALELEGVPEFQKNARFTAYTEGWGLYSEFLPKEMGFYEDPYSDFGRLAMELWRACRLVVDTGLHDKKWSREEAIEYLVENTPNPEADAQKAIERYTVYVGQATAYLIGKQKILELREYAQDELGEAFDIRGFHDEVLRDGPVPLSILEAKIYEWVESQKAN